MQEEDVLSGIVDTLVEKEVYRFNITIDQPRKLSIWDRLLRRKVEKFRTFVIKPCKVCNMARVAGNAVKLPKEILEGNLSEAIMPLIPENIELMTYVIAAAIQNDDQEPKKSLITFIRRHFDNIDIYQGLHAALNGLEMESFLNSIVLAKGTISILKPKTNPMDGSELIASHTE